MAGIATEQLRHAMMSSFLDATQRRRQGLNPLTTTLGQVPHHYNTPNSAAGLSSPFGYSPAPYTPASAVRQYNPQQWGGASNLAVDNGARYQPAQEIEAPAPPPYSPPRNLPPPSASPVEPSSALSPIQRILPTGIHRPSPEPPSTQVFPPPPNTRSRGLSRDRPQALFGLGSVFTRKPATSEGPEPSRLSPDFSREHAGPSRRPLQVSVEPIPVEEPVQIDTRPPAARRAVSTGAIETPSSSRSRGSSTNRWEPGMPLPPPPPGPPPQSNSRSQSMTRSSEPVSSPPTRRPTAASNLGPVPLTPAGWVEGDAIPGPRVGNRSPNPGLHIDTSSVPSSSATDSTSGSSSSGLARARAIRGEPRSIRERRSESRSGKSVAVEEPSNNPWSESITPSDIVVPKTTLGRRPTITKSTPRSARSHHTAGTPGTGRSMEQSTPILAGPSPDSRGSTPRPSESSHQPEAPTPPFSPDQNHPSYEYDSPMIPPKSLPTPPLQSRRSGSSPRPKVAQTFGTETMPISPARTGSRQSGSHHGSLDSFTQTAIQRHNAFAQKEAAAPTDEERVRIFAEFIVSESRLRREQYSAAIDAMGSEILELTRDLFRPYSGSQRNSTHSFSGDRSSKQGDYKMQRGPKLPPLQTASASDSNPSSSSGMPSPSQPRPDSNWVSGYMPSLSPIPSMSASIAPDESSSRGRPSSRWWEVGQSRSGGSPTKLERSKRESKYMGMPRELRESLQYESQHQLSSEGDNHATVAGPSNQASYGPNEYPPEKTGLHEETPISPPPVPGKTPTNASMPYSPARVVPNPRQLDVSRLVTLPPPYPRHHPAVNNNHPELTSIRTSVRALSDFTEVEATKERFSAASQQMRSSAAAAASKRRLSFRSNIQRQIEAGTMSYADAATAEAESAVSEAETSKAGSKADFELFQTSVITPLNDLLMDRVQRATTLFETLRSQLFVDAQQQDPNRAQEEGDEQPELLEKLTLLKWIFEAREQLHKELYELLSDRNDRYKDMVTTPYRLAGNQEKVENATRFFADDARKRKLEFDTGSLSRTIEFMDVIETNVVRGVEVQLSAFWDIAPGLRQVTDRIPAIITRSFAVQIPPTEYDDNPGYWDHPLQYLWSLLEHGQRSAYQFIESQTNLLCLLHEVKSVVSVSKARLNEAEKLSNGEDAAEVERQVSEEREREERRLTDDLKEKVRCVDELWDSALGEAFGSVKGRVREFLVREGGWDGVEDE